MSATNTPVPGRAPITGRDEFDALVVRTDYGNEPAWQALVADLSRPWGDEYEAGVHLVDDPVWAGAAPEEILAVVRQDEELSVVFVADNMTMRSPHRALLALDIPVDEEDLEELIGSPPPHEFRTAPAGVHSVHANLSLANLDFEDFAEEASADPDGLYRFFR